MTGKTNLRRHAAPCHCLIVSSLFCKCGSWNVSEMLCRRLHGWEIMVRRQRWWQTTSSKPKVPENKFQHEHADLLICLDWLTLKHIYNNIYVRKRTWICRTGDESCTRVWGGLYDHMWRKWPSLVKLTVLLVVPLVPSDILRGAEEFSRNGLSPRSPLGRRWSCGLWFDEDVETASHCKNITEVFKPVSPIVWLNRLGRDGLSGGRGKRKQGAEINC